MAKKVEKKKAVKKTKKKASDSARTSLKGVAFALAKEDYNDIRGKDMYELLQNAFDRLATALKGGASVRIPKFGMFKPVVRKARSGFNPKTKEKIEIPERTAVRFKLNREFKEGLNA
jgi:DNA-binding protein HU-beta